MKGSILFDFDQREVSRGRFPLPPYNGLYNVLEVEVFYRRCLDRPSARWAGVSRMPSALEDTPNLRP